MLFLKRWICVLITVLLSQSAAAQREDIDIDDLTMSATSGDLNAQKQLAKHYQSGGQSINDMIHAARWLRQAANQGDAESQTQWASFLTNGRGEVEENPKAAVSWLTRAAAQDHQEAQMRLGWHYQKGSGVKRNHQQAAHWYELGLAQSKWPNPPAYYYLGVLYRSGTGVTKDLTVALAWFERAAESNHPPSLYHLGLMHQYGEGVSVDAAKAAEYFRAVNNDGTYDATGQDSDIQRDGGSIESAAKASLAYLYWQGLGVQRDKAHAAALYAEAAKWGNFNAQYNLGVCYLHGEGIQRNIETAREWLTKSANQGYQRAQISLGHLYNNDTTVPRDIDQALQWFSKAAKQGSEEGTKQMALLQAEQASKAPTVVAQRKPSTKPARRSAPAHDSGSSTDTLAGVAMAVGFVWALSSIFGDSDSTQSSGTSDDSIKQCANRIVGCWPQIRLGGFGAGYYDMECESAYSGQNVKNCEEKDVDINDRTYYCDPVTGNKGWTSNEVASDSCR